MRRTLLLSLSITSALSLGMPAGSVYASGMFDWMSPNKWFNNGRDYDRDYYYQRGYGYGYPGYAYPGWGGYGYSGGYPGTFGYPAWGYPGYNYPVVPTPQSNTTQAPPPTPQ